MKLFLSAGEPSGDLHGANLVRAIHARQPGARISALGGPLMRAAGAEIVYPLAEHAVMGVYQIVTSATARSGTSAPRSPTRSC
jgi:lipid-A-disaccharide synthase